MNPFFPMLFSIAMTLVHSVNLYFFHFFLQHYWNRLCNRFCCIPQNMQESRCKCSKICNLFAIILLLILFDQFKANSNAEHCCFGKSLVFLEAQGMYLHYLPAPSHFWTRVHSLGLEASDNVQKLFFWVQIQVFQQKCLISITICKNWISPLEGLDRADTVHIDKRMLYVKCVISFLFWVNLCAFLLFR